VPAIILCVNTWNLERADIKWIEENEEILDHYQIYGLDFEHHLPTTKRLSTTSTLVSE
jgi:hypothetical protein